MIRNAILFGCILLAGCMHHRAPDVQFYTLPITNSNLAPVSDIRSSIDVGRIKIPEYIDRPQIVTVKGADVHNSQTHRWAENFARMMQRQIIAGVGTYLPKSTVKSDNFIADSGDYAVFIEIYKLDAALGQDITMDAVYSVIDENGENVALKNVHYTMPVGDTYSDYAATVSDMTWKLAREISKTVAGHENKK